MHGTPLQSALAAEAATLPGANGVLEVKNRLSAKLYFRASVKVSGLCGLRASDGNRMWKPWRLHCTTVTGFC